MSYETGNFLSTVFNQYALAFEQAARALADYPEAQYDDAVLRQVCRDHGLIIEDCSPGEVAHLFSLADEFMGG